MAKKNRSNLSITIDDNLPDNTTNFIEPVLHREVEDDLKDSNFNLEDDTAADVNYTPSTPSNWGNTVPTETGEALDELAKNQFEKVTFYMSSSDSTSGAEPFSGLIEVDLTSETKTGNIANAFYQVSFDGVTGWIEPNGIGSSTLVDFQNWVNANITNEDFWGRSPSPTSSGSGAVGFKYKKV
jgi:hypothetical protein